MKYEINKIWKQQLNIYWNVNKDVIPRLKKKMEV
jgi:hypothetical protein